MRSSVLRLAQRLFLWAGVAILAYAVGTATYAGMYQRYQSWKFEREISAPRAVKVSIKEEAADLQEGDVIGKLEIRRLGI